MNKKENIMSYEAPKVIVETVEVEKGFAVSSASAGANSAATLSNVGDGGRAW